MTCESSHMATSRRRKTPGLYKLCKHISWEHCACPWWGQYQGHRVSLKKWTGKLIPDKRAAGAALRRVQDAIDAGSFDPTHELKPPSASTLAQFLDDYERLHVTPDLRSNSASAYVEV